MDATISSLERTEDDRATVGGALGRYGNQIPWPTARLWSTPAVARRRTQQRTIGRTHNIRARDARALVNERNSPPTDAYWTLVVDPLAPCTEVPALHLARLLDARPGKSAAHGGLRGGIRPITRRGPTVWVSGEVGVAGLGFITSNCNYNYISHRLYRPVFLSSPSSLLRSIVALAMALNGLPPALPPPNPSVRIERQSDGSARPHIMFMGSSIYQTTSYVMSRPSKCTSSPPAISMPLPR